MHRELAGGVTDADAKDLVRASHRPQGPSTQSLQDMRDVPVRVPVNTTGWQADHPLVRDDFPAHPTPGVAAADRIMDAQDRRDYEERIDQEARLLLASKNR
jgi:hypothetical protein